MSIERATSFETSIEIISAEDVQLGIDALKWRFGKVFVNPRKVSLSPVMQAGVIVARDLARNDHLPLNPIRMSYYQSDGLRLESPVCKNPLDITQVLDFQNGETLPVIFTEAVVDTQSTLLAAMDSVREQIDEVNREHGTEFDYPEFHVFALISKINGETKIPNLNYAYKLHPDIWAVGYGCDADGRARTLMNIKGYKSPFASAVPQTPYAVRSDLTEYFMGFYRL